MLRTFVLALVTGAVVVAGCSPTPTAEEVIAGVPGASAQHEAVEVRMSVDSSPGAPFVVEGVTALDGSAADTTMSFTNGGTTSSTPVRYIDGTYYYGDPSGEQWYTVTTEELAAFTGLDVAAAPQRAATDVLDNLSDLSSSVEEVGTEEVNGVDATHYRFSIPSENLIAEGTGTGMFSGELGEQMEQMYPDTIEMNMWVDADNLPRKIQWRLTLDMSGMEGAGGVDELVVTTTIEYLEWTTSVNVEAPPSDQVIPMSEAGR